MLNVSASEHSSARFDFQVKASSKVSEFPILATSGDVCRHFPFGAAWVIFLQFMCLQATLHAEAILGRCLMHSGCLLFLVQLMNCE